MFRKQGGLWGWSQHLVGGEVAGDPLRHHRESCDIPEQCATHTKKMYLNPQAADRSSEKGNSAVREVCSWGLSKQICAGVALSCWIVMKGKSPLMVGGGGQGSDGMTQRAAEAAPRLTVFLYGGPAVARRLLAAVPLHFYSCHWGTAAGVSATLIFHIRPGSRYQIKPSKEDHRERRIPTQKVPRFRGVLLFCFFCLFFTGGK